MQINFSEISKENYFYSLIVILGASIHGLNDLYSRGMILKVKDETNDIDEYKKFFNQDHFEEHIKRDLKNFKTFTPQIFSFECNKLNRKESYYLDIEKFSKNLIDSDVLEIYEIHILSVIHITIITAFEKINKKSLKQSEVFQFFRHIRNAAAHNGKFHFTPNVINKNTGQLIFGAKWSDFEITSNMQNQNLFNSSKSSNDRYWNYGDLIDFLIDFENHYPELKSK